MSRFDVFEYGAGTVPLVIDVQCNLLSDLSTCVVIPLMPEKFRKAEALPRLKPILTISGQNYVLMSTEIGAVPRNVLGKFIRNVEDQYRQEIIEAIDLLFQGF